MDEEDVADDDDAAAVRAARDAFDDVADADADDDDADAVAEEVDFRAGYPITTGTTSSSAVSSVFVEI